MKISRKQLRKIILNELNEITPAPAGIDADDYSESEKEIALSNAIKNIKKQGGVDVGWGFDVHPVAGLTTITDRITPGRDFMHGGHGGIDYGVLEGTDILAIADGSVKKVYGTDKGEDPANGFGLDIQHDTINGVEHSSQYIHMKELPILKTGDSVKAGQTIGLVGNTGRSFGQHLHFQVKQNGYKVDPKMFYKKSQSAMLELKNIKSYIRQIINEKNKN